MRIATTFPLLALPAELRLMIYSFCLTFAGVDKWFDKFWAKLRDSSRPSKVAAPLVYKRTPEILLVCKQVYHEARDVLQKKGISFHHGLLDIDGLHNLMNVNILTNISCITVTASGHEIIPKAKGLVGPSWRGHLDLIVEISDVLAAGHRLKTFTLDLTDASIDRHVHDCWNRPIRCDFRDQLTAALENLRKIRSVGTVTLIGLPAALIPDLKARMESSPPSLLSLPGELRNLIYFFAADTSDISTQLTRTMRAWVAANPTNTREKKVPPPYPARTTPTVLLINKQIHAEAKSILYAKPLVLDLPNDKSLQQSNETLNALRFISPRTLAQVQHLAVRVESWEWVWALDRMLPHLGRVQALKSFQFVFVDGLKSTFMRQCTVYPDRTLHESLKNLGQLRGLGHVQFGGDLPEVYTMPMRAIMESVEVAGEVLPKLMGVKEVVNENGEGRSVRIVEMED